MTPKIYILVVDSDCNIQIVLDWLVLFVCYSLRYIIILLYMSKDLLAWRDKNAILGFNNWSRTTLRVTASDTSVQRFLVKTDTDSDPNCKIAVVVNELWSFCTGVGESSFHVFGCGYIVPTADDTMYAQILERQSQSWESLVSKNFTLEMIVQVAWSLGTKSLDTNLIFSLMGWPVFTTNTDLKPHNNNL